MSTASQVCYRHEPDNEKIHALALYLKQGLHRFPYLRAGDNCPAYEELWRLALCEQYPKAVARILASRIGKVPSGLAEANIQRRCTSAAKRESAKGSLPLGIRVRLAALHGMTTRSLRLSEQHVSGYTLVKSVHAALAVPWISQKFRPRLLIIRRHPFGVAASYLRLGLPDARRNVFSQDRLVEDSLDPSVRARVVETTNPLEQVGFQLAIMERYLQEFTANHDACIVEHEALCRDPLPEFVRLFDELGLPWEDTVERCIVESDRPGRGFATQRVRSDEVDKWKRELTGEQKRVLTECFALMEVSAGIPQ